MKLIRSQRSSRRARRRTAACRRRSVPWVSHQNMSPAVVGRAPRSGRRALRRARPGPVAAAGRAVTGRAVRGGRARRRSRWTPPDRAPWSAGRWWDGIHRDRRQRGPRPVTAPRRPRRRAPPPRAQQQPDDHREQADEGHLRADEDASRPAREPGRRSGEKRARRASRSRRAPRRRQRQRGGDQQDQQREGRLARTKRPSRVIANRPMVAPSPEARQVAAIAWARAGPGSTARPSGSSQP